MQKCLTTSKKDSILSNYHYQNQEFNIIADVWLCSSQEKNKINDKQFSGAYPAGFLKRLKSAFSEYYPKNSDDILHVCAGRIDPSEGWRLDISEDFDPDTLGSAEDMGELKDESFGWVMADPPYNEEASEKYYGMPLLNKSKMMKEMTRVCKVGGFVALLDQTTRQAPKALKRIALIGVTSVPNTDMRLFTVWRKIA